MPSTLGGLDDGVSTNRARGLCARRSLIAALCCLSLLACETPPPKPPPTAPPRQVEVPAPTTVTPAPSAPAPEPAPAPQGPAPLPVADVPRAVAAAREMLENGQEAQAAVELQRVLATDSGNRAAASLLRQIKEGPQAILGTESWPYVVQPGESLSSLAQRFLNDVNLFYSLARLNDIKVPKVLAAGQTIRIPGKRPATQTPRPGTTPTGKGADPARVAPGSTAPSPASPAPSEAAKAAQVERLLRQARAARARGDLATALRHLDTLLEIDPEHERARAEREDVQRLIERLKKAPKVEPAARP